MSARIATAVFVLLLGIGGCGSDTTVETASQATSQPVPTKDPVCADLAGFTSAFAAWGAKWEPRLKAALAELDTNARRQDVPAWKASWSQVGMTLADSAAELRGLKVPPDLFLAVQKVADATDKSSRIATQFGNASVAYIAQNNQIWQQSAADQGSAVTKMSFEVGVAEGLHSCK